MKNVTRSMLCIATLVLAAAPALGQGWTYVSPLGMTGQSQLSFEPGSPLSALRISSDEAGDLQWAYLGLSLPGGTLIDSVSVCWERLVDGVFISQVRLVRMSTPDASLVVVDDGTDLTDPGPACHASAAAEPYEVTSSIALALRLNFTDAAGVIEIGGIGIHTTPVVTSVNDDPGSDTPRASLLDQNQPNPFNPSTRIAFDLPRSQRVQLEVHTVDGKRVSTLVDRELAAGRHELDWNGRDDRGRLLPSGVYLYRLVTTDREETRRMTLVR